ncbi:MAG TPA: response regulator [Paenibacillus sp.]|uniref:response regulator n=1 Tax=Paenibacillus sp. TaxID=58172 RepID=UPI002C930B52|nr:response regulator [Paenibacillus sp.]HUC92852.1 response regulator [Paenibacillus sp.]
MINVILADDHFPVLEFLSKSIPWDDMGLKVVAQCADGVEALEQCRLGKTDILISDIGMPGMDGLQLITEAKAMHPDLQVVILSCHDEFQYAQRALKLGVTDYILKESLQPEELADILQRIKAEIDDRSAVRDQAMYLSRVVNQSGSAIKAGFIRNTISNPIVNEHKWLSEWKEFGLTDLSTPIMAVMVYPNRYLSLTERFETEQLMMYAFDNVLNEVIDRNGYGVSFQYSAKHVFILFPFPKTLKFSQYELIRGYLAKLLSSFHTLGISVSAVTNEAVAATPYELKKSLTSLLSAADQRFYAPEGSIYKWVPFRTSNEDIFACYQKASDDFRKLIAVESADYRMVVREWIQLLRDERFPAESVRAWLLKLVIDIEVKYKSLQYFDDGQSVQSLHTTVLNMESLFEVEDFLQSFVEEKIRLAGSLKGESRRREIYEAKKYVAARLHEKISMEEAALALHMNASHFSRMFKNETGETFIEYVTRLKMEKAREMLGHTDKSVERIGESLGYDNTSYFIKLFKNYSGHSPKEYRLLR